MDPRTPTQQKLTRRFSKDGCNFVLLDLSHLRPRFPASTAPIPPLESNKVSPERPAVNSALGQRQISVSWALLGLDLGALTASTIVTTWGYSHTDRVTHWTVPVLDDPRLTMADR